MLASFLESYFKDTELKLIFSDVIGTNNATDIQVLIERATENHLQTNIEKILFIQSSIGVVT